MNLHVFIHHKIKGKTLLEKNCGGSFVLLSQKLSTTFNLWPKKKSIRVSLRPLGVVITILFAKAQTLFKISPWNESVTHIQNDRQTGGLTDRPKLISPTFSKSGRQTWIKVFNY